MIVYCTACCKKKRDDLRKLTSIERYISGRIIRVYKKSGDDKVGFRIFSGKYGLLRPVEKILWYDEKLDSGKISKMTELLKKQILRQKISQIVFFTYNPKRYPGLQPYFEALKSACGKAKIEWRARYL